MDMRHVVPSARLRAAEDAPEGRMTGLVATYDDKYDIGFGFQESIQRGAFDEWLREHPVLPIYYQHGHRFAQAPIGVGTFRSTPEGLEADVELFMDNPTSQAVYRVGKAGGGSWEWSIGFRPTEDGIETKDRGQTEVITRAKLHEASIVLMGANPNTKTIEVRETPEEVEREIAAAGVEIPEHLLANLDRAEVRDIVRDLIAAEGV